MLNPSDFFEKIQSHFEGNLPFAVFRKPNSNKVVAFLQNNLSDQAVEALTEGFLIAPFDKNSSLLAIRKDEMLTSDFTNPKKTLTTPNTIQWDNIDQKKHHQNLFHLKHSLQIVFFAHLICQLQRKLKIHFPH